MTTRKTIWGTLDHLEGRTDSTYEAFVKEVKRQRDEARFDTLGQPRG